MISVIWNVCWMERKIVFEVQRGESVVINKMDAKSRVAASWHCTKMKCLKFLPSCAGGSLGVRTLAIGSTFPLTTCFFSLLLHPSAPNSWTCTSLTTTSNKKQVFRFSVYRRSKKMVWSCLCVLQPAARGRSKYFSFTSVYFFHSFHEGGVLRPQLAVRGFRLPNARPVIISAYNRTHQKTLAPPFIYLPILHHLEQRMGTVAKRSFLSLNKGHLVG